MQREIPMLFQTPMVMATIEGRKTKTRRTQGLELQNEKPDDWKLVSVGYFSYPEGNKVFEHYGATFMHKHYQSSNFMKARYAPGDILWVRETFSYYRPFGEDRTDKVIYKADRDDCDQYPLLLDGELVMVSCREPWKPSIHMHKIHARIWLRITAIRVERLQMVIEKDAKAEGILFYKDRILGGERFKDYVADASGYGKPEVDYPTVSRAYESFETLWISINGDKSWESNPWVWVITFKVLSTTGRPLQLKEVSNAK